MSGPWEKYQKKPWERHAPEPTRPVATPTAGRDPFAKNFGRDTNDVRGLGNAASRMITKGLAAPPLMAMDLGVATRNVGEQAYRGIAGKPQQPEHELPSSMFNRWLDERTIAPATTAGRLAELGGSALVSGALPSPAPLNALPRSSPRPTPKEVTFEAGRREGLVAPPASANKNQITRTLETIGGKTGTAQDASLRNTKTFTDMARRYLGVTDDTPITPDLLSQMRAKAADAYEDLRGVGEITADPKYFEDLQKITANSRGAASAFPGLAKNNVEEIASAMQQKQFDSNSAVDALSILRENASIAFRKGDSDAGHAYRAAAKALEEMLDRALERGGKSPDVLKKFRDARKLIAKTHSVEDALNPATGNVVGQKLAGLLNKGAPLSGELQTAGRFAQAFPRASMEMLDSGAVRNTDLIVGGGTAVLSREPWWLLYPFVRDATRAGVLSNAGQRLGARGAAQAPYGPFQGALPVTQGLFTQ